MRTCACEKQKYQEGWREEMEVREKWEEGWSESEKDMTSLRKCWAGFKGYWMKHVYTVSAPSLFLFLSLEMYSAGRFPIPTWLVNGRGVEYFKQPFTLLFSSLLPSLSFPPTVRLCISQVHTHDPVSATAVHSWNLHDIMLYFWVHWDAWRYSECPAWLSIASPRRQIS